MLSKRISCYCLIAGTLLANGASAQKTEFGFIAGPQFTNSTYYLHGKKQATTGKFGGHAGAIARIPFEGRLFFTPSLYYSMKGFSVTLTDTSSNPGIDAVANDLRIHAFELSPLFTIYVGRATDSGPYVQFGPSIDMNVAGREKVTVKNGAVVSRNMSFSGQGYSRLTPSVVLRFGVQTPKGFFVNAHILQGIGSLNNNDFGPAIRHRVFGLSVGKFFLRN
ncbi:MAG: PorT family protein [Chitinophagaceae bacterium]|nr:MAG: PorT family protein [Chitinophagaceae bacterium]